MDIRKLQRAIVDGLEDVKGQNIVVFDTEKLSSLFERVIIASGTSNRQTKALAASVRDAVKALGAPPPRIEGEDNGEWIIVDCGAAVVHLMQPTIREYYHLEEIWGAKPVKVKLDTAPKGLVKASVADDDAPAAKPARKAAAKALSKTAAKTAAKAAAKAEAEPAPAAKKAPARKKAVAVVEEAAPVAKKAPARKKAAEAAPVPAAKKAPVGKGGVTRTAGVKVAAKSPAKKAVATSTAPVKTMVVKAPVAVAKQAADKKAMALKKAAAAKRAATPKAPKAVATKTGKSAKG